VCAKNAKSSVTADNFTKTLFPKLEGWQQAFLLLDALIVDMGDSQASIALWHAMKSIGALQGYDRFYYERSTISNYRTRLMWKGVPYTGSYGYSDEIMPDSMRRGLLALVPNRSEPAAFVKAIGAAPETFEKKPGLLALAQTAAIYCNMDMECLALHALGPGSPERRLLLRIARPGAAWMEARTPTARWMVADDAVKNFLFHGEVSEAFLWAQKRLLAGDAQAADVLHPSVKAAVYYWSGLRVRAMAAIGGLKDAEAYWTVHFLQAVDLLLTGNPACLARFASCEKLYAKTRKIRKRLTPDALGLWHALALFLHGSVKELGRLRTEIAPLANPDAGDPTLPWAGKWGFRALQALDLLRLGKEADGLELIRKAGMGMEENCFSALFSLAACARFGLFGEDKAACLALERWEKAVRSLPALSALFGQLMARAGLPWTPQPADPPFGQAGSAEAAPAGASSPDSAPAAGSGQAAAPLALISFASLVEDKSPWQLRLGALVRIANGLDGAEAEQSKTKRLLWIVDEDLESVEAMEQARGVRGWNKPRNCSLKRLVEKGASYDWLRPEDRSVISCIERGQGWWSGMSLSLETCCESLEGQDNVYVADADDGLVHVKIKRGSLGLRLCGGKDGACRLTVDGAGLSGQDLETKSVVFAFARGEGIIWYFKPTVRERQIAGIVGSGLDFPRSELSKVFALTRQDGAIPLRADIEAEAVEADPSPVLQLEQTPGGGFSAQVGVRPFARPKTPFFPTGAGVAEPLAALAPEAAGREAGAEAGPAVPLRTKRDFEAETEALQALAEACPALGENLEEGKWTSQEPAEVLELLEQLRDCGLKSSLEWPKGRALRLAGTLKVQNVKLSVAQAGAGRDWFALSGEAAIDEDRVMSLKELLQALQGSRFVSLGGGEYLALTEELRRRLAGMKAMMAEKGRGAMQFSGLAAGAMEKMAAGMDLKMDQRFEASLERMHKAFEAEPRLPARLRAELRDYQREGYVWMQRLAIWGVGACLADDMGLGKTVQTIAVMLNQAASGPCLVVAPTTVCANWEIELGRFAPTLSAKRLGMAGRAETVQGLGPNDVLVVGYGLLANVSEELSQVKWAMAVFDEAQALKNPLTKRAKAAREISAQFRVALTGTPIENRIDDLWSIFAVINPGLLGGYESFRKRFGQAAPGTSASRTLRQLTRPFLLRRLKSAVLDELPSRTEQNIVIEPSDDEKAFYELLRREAMENLEQAPPEQKRFLILLWLTRLRRACCHPSLAAGDLEHAGEAFQGMGSKIERLLDVLEELVAGGHKVLVFSQFTSFLALVQEALGKAGTPYLYLDGQTPEKKRRERVDAFQNGACDVFLLSLKAGGTGINLTAADYVVHLDPWWNPAVEDQASDRAHRLGQKRPVTIYRFVTAGSVEEKIIAMHQEKRELAADFLEGTSTSVTSLSDEELLALLQ